MPSTRKVLFMKYRDNRRLYNRSTSQYATIQDVAKVVQEGNTVQVLVAEGKARRYEDRGTLQDVTQGVLVDAFRAAEVIRPRTSVEVLVALIRGTPVIVPEADFPPDDVSPTAEGESHDE